MLQKSYNIINKKPPDQWCSQLARELIKMTRTEAARTLRRTSTRNLLYAGGYERHFKGGRSGRTRSIFEVYWIAHIDEALLNIKGWTRRSLTNLEDVITSLEKRGRGGR